MTLVTLGGWALFAPGSSGPSPQLGPSKPLALLVYLALSPGRTAAREHLLDLLWADLDPSAATHAYRQTVWYIRQRIGDDCLQTGGGSITLTCPSEVDRDAFLDAVESQDLESAILLYKGHFLPGFAAPGGAEFEKWADLERYRLRGLFVRCASRLARRHMESGHARDAVALARRVRDADRDNEAGWRLYLEALASSGDHLTAAVEADQLERLLAAEGIEPDPGTRNAIRLARQQPKAEAETAAATLVAELVGREKDFGAIVAAWDACRRGASRHIHIMAAAGYGKSRLLNDAHTRLRASGARAVLLRATPGERTLSYAFASDVASALAELPGATAVSTETAGTLVALSPPLAARFPSAEPDRSTGDEAARRRLLAVVDLVAAVADEAPLALLLDDIHWADTHSRQVLSNLLDRLARTPVLVVSTARPVPEGTFERPDTEHVVLQPLTIAQVGAFVASLGTVPDEAWARTLPTSLHAVTRGSPLTLLETLQLAIERSVLTLGPDGWRCPDSRRLAELLAGGAALRMRLELLTREQRWLLLLSATHGAPLAWEQLLAATARTEDALQADVTALEQRGLVARPHGQWQPAHDAIADMAGELAGPEAVRAAHAALACALEATSADDHLVLPRVAQHRAAAGEDAALTHTYRRWVRTLRRQGDRRSLVVLGEELLGAESNARAAALARSLPMTTRLGLDLPARAAAASLVVLAGAVAIVTAAVRASAPPDGTLVIIAETADERLVDATLDVHADGWERGGDIVVSRFRAATPAIAGVVAAQYPPYDTPGGFVQSRATGDSGVIDVFRISSDSVVRLTASIGDDNLEFVVPDGRFAALTTGRWRNGSYDAAALDLRTGRAWPISASDDHEIGVALRSDLAAALAVRRPVATGARGPRISVCAIQLPTRAEQCWTYPGGESFRPLAWVGPWTVVGMLADTSGSTALTRLDLATGGRSPLTASDVIYAEASPDGRFIVAQMRSTPLDTAAWYILNVAGDARPRRLLLKPGSTQIARVVWRRLPVPPVRLRAVAPSAPIPLDNRYTLTARAEPAGKTPYLVPALWTSLDTTIANVDSLTGRLRPRAIGAARVVARLGLDASDTIVVRVGEPGARLVRRETWQTLDSAFWRPFGEPQPLLDEGPSGRRAIRLNGDSSYTSGVYSQPVGPSPDGLGMEAAVSVPLTAAKWQSASLFFIAGADSASLATWDHRSGSFPFRPRLANTLCGWGYQAEFGRAAANHAMVSAHGITTRILDSWRLATGAWATVRVQLFPDGRCGVAINGRPIVIVPSHVDMSLRYRALLASYSHRTRIRVGPMEIWEGVRNDVDWSLLDDAAPVAPGTRPAAAPATAAARGFTPPVGSATPRR